jgi:NADH-quinone oxidoreductase subunit C
VSDEKPAVPAGGPPATTDPHDAVQENQGDGGVVPVDQPTTPTIVGRRRGMFGAADGGDTSGYGGLQQLTVLPGATARPYGGYFDAVADALEASLRGDGRSHEGPDGPVEKVVVDRGEMTLHVRRAHLPDVCRRLRDEPDLRFELSMGVSGVHYPDDSGRELHAVYHLRSVTHGRRLRLEVTCPDADPHIPSTVDIYPTHDWHERETWDFFGIVFDGHPALTRIEMPDDWPGHPQRKDYPLGGIPVEYKGATVPPPDERRAYS